MSKARSNLSDMLSHWDHRFMRLKEALQQHPPGLEALFEEMESSRVLLLELLEEQEISRRLIEQARREWTAALDAVQDPIFLHDAEFRIVRANLAYARCAGLPIQETLGKPYWEVFPRRDGPLPGCMQALHEEHYGDEEEIELDGGVVFRSRSYPIQDTDGRYLFSLHIMQDITVHKRAADAEARARLHLERSIKAMEQAVQAVALTVEKRDPYTSGHQQRVAELAVAIAREMGFDADRIQGLYLGGLIHDIGKIYVPAEILSRPGRISPAEFAIIKSHPQVGYDIVKGVDFPWPVAQIILQHHERLDGSGYPHGLTGEAILPEARILAVADVVEAMASHRPYRASRGIEDALDEIVRGRGVLYDCEAVDACLRLFREKGYTLGV